jgi:hypothetical protein
MSSLTTFKAGPTTLPLRLAAIAGILAAAILFVNAGKRAGLIPLSPLTHPQPGTRNRPRLGTCHPGRVRALAGTLAAHPAHYGPFRTAYILHDT